MAASLAGTYPWLLEIGLLESFMRSLQAATGIKNRALACISLTANGKAYSKKWNAASSQIIPGESSCDNFGACRMPRAPPRTVRCHPPLDGPHIGSSPARRAAIALARSDGVPSFVARPAPNGDTFPHLSYRARRSRVVRRQVLDRQCVSSLA